MIGSLFKALGTGLEIWHDERSKALSKKMFKLEKEWLQELDKKPPYIRDSARMDLIERELRLLVDRFSREAKVPRSNSGLQP